MFKAGLKHSILVTIYSSSPSPSPAPMVLSLKFWATAVKIPPPSFPFLFLTQLIYGVRDTLVFPVSKVSLSNTALGCTLFITFFKDTSLLLKPLTLARSILKVLFLLFNFPRPQYTLFFGFTSTHPLPPTISCLVGAGWGNPPPRVSAYTGSRIPTARAYTGYHSGTREEVPAGLVTGELYFRSCFVATEGALSATDLRESGDGAAPAAPVEDARGKTNTCIGCGICIGPRFCRELACPVVWIPSYYHHIWLNHVPGAGLL